MRVEEGNKRIDGMCGEGFYWLNGLLWRERILNLLFLLKGLVGLRIQLEEDELVFLQVYGGLFFERSLKDRVGGKKDQRQRRRGKMTCY